MRLSEVAELTGGELCNGNPDFEVSGVASLSESTSQDVTFFFDQRYISVLRKCRAAAVFVTRDFSENVASSLIKVDNPSIAFAALVKHFSPPPIAFERGVHPTAIIGKDVILGEGVSVQPYAIIESGARIGTGTVIGAYSYIGHETQVGEDCLFYTRVTIRERCKIANRVILHPGVVIGADGFGYEPPKPPDSGKYAKIPQMGFVQIDDDVEIGANTTIDRARFGKTWIMEGVKIDNLVMIGHNVIIGPHTILCGQVGVSGSSKVGSYATLAGQVGIAGHLEIGDHALLMAQTGITKNVPPKGVYFGSPGEPVKEYKRRFVYASSAWMEKLIARVKALEKKQ